MNVGMLIAAALLVGSASAPAFACSPVPMTDAQRGEAEDRNLLEATVFFRGVIENVRPDETGEPIMDIRWTRTLWGHGAPSRISIETEYFAMCARGNLHAAVDMEGRHPELPAVRNGMGVTVIGRSGDGPWDLIILVDGAADTEGVVTRFQKLRFGW